MTDTTTGFEIQFAGDGSTTGFDVTTFHIADDDDIKVYLLNETTKAATLQTKTTHYSVSIAEAGTFTVTMVTAPASTEQLFITLDRARTQPTDFIINGKLSEQSLEEQLDEFPRQVKSLESDVKRSIKGPVGFGDGELGAYPALGLVRINSDQNGFEAVTVSGLNLSSFTFDWADLADLGGSVDASADKLLIYDASADENKFINTEDLTVSNTASNVGTAGVGVFKQKTGNDLEFKNISVGSTKVTVTDDTGNNEIDIDVDGGKILDDEISGNGLVARTTTETYTNRTLTGTADEIHVADGDGVSGNPTVGIADNAQFPGTEGIRIPNGTTAQRPGSPAVGDLRYNTTTSKVEAYQGSSWVDIDDVDIAGLTQESTLDSTVDMIAIYDDSATANRKVDLDDLAAGLDVTQFDGTTAATAASDTSADFLWFTDASDSNSTKKALIEDVGTYSLLSTTSISSASSTTVATLDLTTYDYRFLIHLNQVTGADSHAFKIDTNTSANADWTGTSVYLDNSTAAETYSSQAEGRLSLASGSSLSGTGDHAILDFTITLTDNSLQYVSGVFIDNGIETRYNCYRTGTGGDESDVDVTVYYNNVSGSGGMNGTLSLYRIKR